jgi:hypothetical protein
MQGTESSQKRGRGRPPLDKDGVAGNKRRANVRKKLSRDRLKKKKEGSQQKVQALQTQVQEQKQMIQKENDRIDTVVTEEGNEQTTEECNHPTTEECNDHILELVYLRSLLAEKEKYIEEQESRLQEAGELGGKRIALLRSIMTQQAAVLSYQQQFFPQPQAPCPAGGARFLSFLFSLSNHNTNRYKQKKYLREHN